MSDARKPSEKPTETMLNALRRVEKGLDLAGHYSAKTIRALRNRGFIEGAYSLTDAGRVALTAGRYAERDQQRESI